MRLKNHGSVEPFSIEPWLPRNTDSFAWLNERVVATSYWDKWLSRYFPKAVTDTHFKFYGIAINKPQVVEALGWHIDSDIPKPKNNLFIIHCGEGPGTEFLLRRRDAISGNAMSFEKYKVKDDAMIAALEPWTLYEAPKSAIHRTNPNSIYPRLLLRWEVWKKGEQPETALTY